MATITLIKITHIKTGEEESQIQLLTSQNNTDLIFRVMKSKEGFTFQVSEEGQYVEDGEICKSFLSLSPEDFQTWLGGVNRLA